MERWVSMALARRNGICANMAFPFPNAFLDDLFRRILPDLPDPSPFDPEILAFRIMKRLPAFLERPAFADLKRYLVDDTKGSEIISAGRQGGRPLRSVPGFSTGNDISMGGGAGG